MAESAPGRVPAWGRANNNGPAPWVRPWGGTLVYIIIGLAGRGKIYTQLYRWDNLLLAYQRASRGKRGHANVAAFEYRLEDNLLRLQAELAGQSYQPGPYTSFYIHEPKRRLISAAPFPDRVVHHALGNLIEPLFERSFIFDSYANRIGKGTHRALARCQEFARRYRYVLQADVEQFFPAIDHAILRAILARKIEDERVMGLIDRILAGGIGVLAEEYDLHWFPGDDLLAVLRARGLPIGNLTSQFWANCYLNGFDHFVKRELRCPGYLRYVDDVALFGDDKAVLWDWREALIERLAGLRLTIHPAAQPRPVSEGIPFLGFITYPDRRRLKRRKGLHYRRSLTALLTAYHAGEIPLARVTASVQSWINHVRYGNTVGLRKAMLAAPIKPVIRAED